MTKVTVSKSKRLKGKPDKPGKPPVEPVDPIEPPVEPVEPPPGEPTSGKFKGTVDIDNGEQGKAVEGTFSGTCDPATGEFDVMGVLIKVGAGGGGGGTLQSSVTKGGITLNFAAPTEVLQNFLGDWFIKGPVVISSISPSPTGSGAARRHGAMRNRSNYMKQCFDGRVNQTGSFYDTTDDFLPGSTLNPGDALTCSISGLPSLPLSTTNNDDPYNRALGFQTSNKRVIDEYQVFSCFSTLPSASTFRPQDCGTTRTLWTTADVDPSIFLGLSGHHNPIGTGSESLWRTDGSPDSPGGPNQTDPSQWNICCGMDDTVLAYPAMRAYYQMMFYPSVFLKNLGRLACYTTTNLPNIALYAHRIIQFGIHCLGVTQQTGWGTVGPGNSFCFGAGFSGPFQLPLLFARRALNASVFSNVIASNNGVQGSAAFSENYQTYYTTTPAAEYAAGLAAAGLTGPNYPLWGDWKASPVHTAGANSTDYDPVHNKFNSTPGAGSDPGVDGHFGHTQGSRYQQVDGTCTHFTFGGVYLHQNTGQAHAPARMWSEISGMKSHNPGPWKDFYKWWLKDEMVGRGMGPSGVMIKEAYQMGGTAGDGGGDWLTEYYNAHIASII